MGGTTGSVTGAITTNGVLGVNRSDVVTLDNTIGGSGQLRQDGTGTTILTGTNTYSGGTIINSGILSISSDANLGAPSGGITMNGGTLQTTADVSGARATTVSGVVGIETVGATTFTHGGVISGDGALIKTGDGTLLLTAANTYTGGTMVSAGTLQGTTTSLQGMIIDNAALVFDQPFDGAFQGSLFGTGTMNKRGTGMVLLAGDYGLEGLTTVEAGTLALDGSLAGAVTALKGGTFDANGVIGGDLTVDGTVSVRNKADGSFGQLGVVGNVMFNPDATYAVGIDPDGTNSTLVTNGTAAIDGAVVSVAPRDGDYPRFFSYAILGANGGLSGTASAISTSPALKPILTQTGDTLFLTVLNWGRPLQPYSTTGSGWGSGGALDSIKASASGELERAIDILTALPDPQLARALDVIAGEIYPSSAQMSAVDGESVMDILRSEITSRISSQSEEQRAARESNGSLWGPEGVKGWIRVRTDRTTFDPGGPTEGQGGRAGAHGGKSMLEGVVLGGDARFASHWMAGAGFGYTKGHLTLAGLDERADMDVFRTFGYGGYAGAHWTLDAGGSIAYVRRDMTRRFQFAAFGPTGAPLFAPIDAIVTASPNGATYEAWVEHRYNIALKSWDLQPNAALRWASYGYGSFTETGGGSLSLSAESQSIGSFQGDAGLRLDRAVGRFRPFVSGTYRREFASRRAGLDLQFGTTPDGLFEENGIELARDKAIGQAGLTFLPRKAGLSLYYEIQGSGRQLSQSLQLGVRF